MLYGQLPRHVSLSTPKLQAHPPPGRTQRVAAVSWNPRLASSYCHHHPAGRRGARGVALLEVVVRLSDIPGRSPVLPALLSCLVCPPAPGLASIAGRRSFSFVRPFYCALHLSLPLSLVFTLSIIGRELQCVELCTWSRLRRPQLLGVLIGTTRAARTGNTIAHHHSRCHRRQLSTTSRLPRYHLLRHRLCLHRRWPGTQRKLP